MTEEHLIKKYPNRRLYDTAISQYVTLDDIRRLVRDTVPFQVVDSKSNEDITRSILLQIILDQEEQGPPILTEELLRNIIRFYGDSLQSFMSSYLDKSVSAFLQQQATIHRQIANVMEQTPASVFSQMAGRNLELSQQMLEQFVNAYSANPDRKKQRGD